MVLFKNPTAVPRYAGFNTDFEKESFFNASSPTIPTTLVETTHKENSRQISVPPGLRWIRIAENTAPGWEYRIQGVNPATWLPIQRAPDASMLVPLSASSSTLPTTVEMRYNPPLRRLGFEISAVALLLTSMAGVYVARLDHLPR